MFQREAETQALIPTGEYTKSHRLDMRGLKNQLTVEPDLMAKKWLEFSSNSLKNQNENDLTIAIQKMGRQLLDKVHWAYFPSCNAMIAISAEVKLLL